MVTFGQNSLVVVTFLACQKKQMATISSYYFRNVVNRLYK